MIDESVKRICDSSIIAKFVSVYALYVQMALNLVAEMSSIFE